MDSETFQVLKREFDTSSWAIWSENFPNSGCVEENSDQLVEHIMARSDRLKPWIVLLGLSRSTGETENCENFHSTDNRHSDDVLRLAVEKSGLDGAYMTDIAVDIEPSAKDVEIDDYAKDRLLSQLELLGWGRYYIITFGNDAFNFITESYDGKRTELAEGVSKYTVKEKVGEFEFFSVRHYSQRRSRYLVEFCFQMNFLGDTVIPLEMK